MVRSVPDSSDTSVPRKVVRNASYPVVIASVTGMTPPVSDEEKSMEK
jgi:hypothetical protein